MRSLSLSVLVLAFCTLVAAAAPVQLEVVRMSPSPGVVLPSFGRFYMEIAYRSDQPLRLQARAYAGGEPLDAGQMMNASVVHPAGSGRALVWVGYSEPAAIDEIRVTAYDAKWQPLTVLKMATSARWLAESADRAQPPQWVGALIDAEERLAAAYRQANPPEPDPFGDLMVSFIFLAVPGYFVLQAAALLVLHGRWRWAAFAPLLVMVPAALHAGLALSAGSNLWPIVFIFAAPLGFLYLAVLLAVRWVRGSGPSLA